MANEDWAKALAEAENPAARDAGLWARCFAEADGDEGKAKAAYVKVKMGAGLSSVPPAPPVKPRSQGWCPVCHSEVKIDAQNCQACNSNFAARGMYPLKYKPSSPAPSRSDSYQSYTAPQSADEPKKSSIWKWIIGVPLVGFACFMILGFVLSSSPEGQERSNSRAAIDLCWREQARKSNSSGDARFIAGACEKMESDYRSRWNSNP